MNQQTADMVSYGVKLRGFLEDFERTASLNALDRCIRATSWRCGLLTYLAIRRHLSEARSVRTLDHIDPGFGKEVQELIERISDELVLPKNGSIERKEA